MYVNMEINIVKVILVSVVIVVFCAVWHFSSKFIAPSLKTEMCVCKNKLTGRVAIVTGANTGIGYQTALDLARRDAKVIVACRDFLKGVQAEQRIRKETGNRNVYFQHLDLASLASVCRFVDHFVRLHESVHILINNAGTGKLDNSLTEDYLPIEVQVNYYGPFLLTLLLLPYLKKQKHSRIINVSSVMHHFGRVKPETFHKQAKTWLEFRRVYSDTKLANILFTLKLDEVLEGSSVTVNCLHPGAVYTDFFRHQHFLVQFILRLFFKTPWEGAQTVIHLAVARELRTVSGKYFINNVEHTPSQRALDMDVANMLWLTSERLLEPFLSSDNNYF